MKLTGHDYYRLKSLYPQAQYERKGEPLYIACQRQKRAMRLHVARERYADIKPLWLAIIRVRRAGFTFDEIADVLQTDIETIEQEWDRIILNAR